MSRWHRSVTKKQLRKNLLVSKQCKPDHLQHCLSKQWLPGAYFVSTQTVLAPVKQISSQEPVFGLSFCCTTQHHSLPETGHEQKSELRFSGSFIRAFPIEIETTILISTFQKSRNPTPGNKHIRKTQGNYQNSTARQRRLFQLPENYSGK